MVSTHVGVSLWYDAQTIVHSIDGVVLLCGHYWLDCGTGHTCLQLPSGRVPPCCHRYWNLSYWTDYSAAELKHPYYWRWVTTPPTVYEREKSLDLEEVAGERALYLHSYHSHCGLSLMKEESISKSNAVTRGLLCFNQWNKRLFHCFKRSVPCPCLVYWKSLKIHVLTSWLGPTNTHGICMNCKRLLICYPEPVWLDQAI